MSAKIALSFSCQSKPYSILIYFREVMERFALEKDNFLQNELSNKKDPTAHFYGIGP